MRHQDLLDILQDYDNRRGQQPRYKQIRNAVGNFLFSEYRLITMLKELSKDQKPSDHLSPEQLFSLSQILCADDSQGKSDTLNVTKKALINTLTRAASKLELTKDSREYYREFYRCLESLASHKLLTADSFSALSKTANRSGVESWFTMRLIIDALDKFDLLSQKNIIKLYSCDDPQSAHNFLYYIWQANMTMTQVAFDRLVKMDKGRLSILAIMMGNIESNTEDGRSAYFSNQAIFTLLIRVEKQGFFYDSKRYQALYNFFSYLTDNTALDQQKIDWLMNEKITNQHLKNYQIISIRPLYRMLKVLNDTGDPRYHRDIKPIITDILENIELWDNLCQQEKQVLGQVNRKGGLDAPQCHMIWLGMPETVKKMKQERNKNTSSSPLEFKKEEVVVEEKSSLLTQALKNNPTTLLPNSEEEFTVYYSGSDDDSLVTHYGDSDENETKKIGDPKKTAQQITLGFSNHTSQNTANLLDLNNSSDNAISQQINSDNSYNTDSENDDDLLQNSVFN